MAKKKNTHRELVTVSMSKDIQEMGKRQSEATFGHVNLSGWMCFLILEKEKENKK